ncbi:MAG: RNA-binding domain-containing protein [Thermoprotei archaeon]
MNIRVIAYVKPTEDVEKVKEAVRNVFDGEILVFEEGNGYYRIEGIAYSRKALEKLYELIRIEQIIPATRNYLLRNTRGNTITIMLHKQAAYMGKISLVDSDRESPLGAIRIIIEHANPREIIDWLAPEFKPRRERGKQQRRSSRSRLDTL